jgi:hypothetical protein
MGIARETEATFGSAVKQFAVLHGFACYHTRNSKGSDKGWPDWVFAKTGRLILAELKMPGKKSTPAQRKWMELLATVPWVEVYLWTPESWPEIERVLGV